MIVVVLVVVLVRRNRRRPKQGTEEVADKKPLASKESFSKFLSGGFAKSPEKISAAEQGMAMAELDTAAPFSPLRDGRKGKSGEKDTQSGSQRSRVVKDPAEEEAGVVLVETPEGEISHVLAWQAPGHWIPVRPATTADLGPNSLHLVASCLPNGGYVILQRREGGVFQAVRTSNEQRDLYLVHLKDGKPAMLLRQKDGRLTAMKSTANLRVDMAGIVNLPGPRIAVVAVSQQPKQSTAIILERTSDGAFVLRDVAQQKPPKKITVPTFKGWYSLVYQASNGGTYVRPNSMYSNSPTCDVHGTVVGVLLNRFKEVLNKVTEDRRVLRVVQRQQALRDFLVIEKIEDGSFRESDMVTEPSPEISIDYGQQTVHLRMAHSATPTKSGASAQGVDDGYLEVSSSTTDEGTQVTLLRSPVGKYLVLEHYADSEDQFVNPNTGAVYGTVGESRSPTRGWQGKAEGGGRGGVGAEPRPSYDVSMAQELSAGSRWSEGMDNDYLEGDEVDIGRHLAGGGGSGAPTSSRRSLELPPIPPPRPEASKRAEASKRPGLQTVVDYEEDEATRMVRKMMDAALAPKGAVSAPGSAPGLLSPPSRPKFARNSNSISISNASGDRGVGHVAEIPQDDGDLFGRVSMGYIEVAGRESMFPGSAASRAAEAAGQQARSHAKLAVRPSTKVDGAGAQRLLADAGSPDGAFVLQGDEADASTVWLHVSHAGRALFFQVRIDEAARDVHVNDDDDIVVPDLSLFIAAVSSPSPNKAKKLLPCQLTQNLTPKA